MNFLHNLHSASFGAGRAVAPVKERKGAMEEGLMGRKKEGRKKGREGGREGKKRFTEYFCHSRQKI